MPRLIDRCPSCGGGLEVAVLRCPQCEIQLSGHFDLPPRTQPAASGPVMPGLSPEQMAFLRVFVVSRGNLSDVERTLGISYPTVRAKLDDLIDAVTRAPIPAVPAIPVVPAIPAVPPISAVAATPGVPATPAAPPLAFASRREVLTAIASGQLSAAQGAHLLKQLAAGAPAAPPPPPPSRENEPSEPERDAPQDQQRSSEE